MPATAHLSSLPLLHAALVGRFLALLVVVVKHAAGQTGARADGRPHSGVAGHGPDQGPAGSAPGRTGQRSLLRRRHVAAGGERRAPRRDADQPLDRPLKLMSISDWSFRIGTQCSATARVALSQIAENPFDRRRVHRLGVLLRPGDEAGDGLVARRPRIRLAEQRRLFLGRRRDLMVLVGPDREAVAEVQRGDAGGIGRRGLAQPYEIARGRDPEIGFGRVWPSSARVRRQPS